MGSVLLHKLPSCSSPSSPGKPYDVFLSHAGYGAEKQGIASQLCRELRRHGIRVFFDKDCFKAGEKSKPRMIWAAATAKVFVAVVSKEYAKRKWTMKELKTSLATKNSETFHAFKMEGHDEGLMAYIENIIVPDHVTIIPLFFSLTANDCKDYKNSIEDEEEKESYPDEWNQALKDLQEREGISYQEMTHTHQEYAKMAAKTIQKDHFPNRKSPLQHPMVIAIAILLLVGVGVAVLLAFMSRQNKPQAPDQQAFTTPTSGPSMTPKTNDTVPCDDGNCQSTTPPTSGPSTTPTTNDSSPCDSGGCQSMGSICFEGDCCEECKRIVLTSVDTAGDGEGCPDVEATFFINGVALFGGEQILPCYSLHTFSKMPNSVGNLRPGETVTFRVLERDFGGILDPHDNDEFPLFPGTWYSPEETAYQRDLSFANWRWYYTVETECCTD